MTPPSFDGDNGFLYSGLMYLADPERKEEQEKQNASAPNQNPTVVAGARAGAKRHWDGRRSAHVGLGATGVVGPNLPCSTDLQGRPVHLILQ